MEKCANQCGEQVDRLSRMIQAMLRSETDIVQAFQLWAWLWNQLPRLMALVVDILERISKAGPQARMDGVYLVFDIPYCDPRPSDGTRCWMDVFTIFLCRS